jgi:glucose-6-phosphate-specific signal transduction histidine kinase
MIRPDFIFSNWLFIWFLIYYFFSKNISKDISHWVNPYYAFWVALIENIISMIYIFTAVKNTSFFLILYATMLFFIKIIPIYLLSKTDYRGYYWQKFIFLLAVITIYCIYLFFNHTSVIEVYHKIERSLIRQDDNTPFFFLMARIREKLL